MNRILLVALTAVFCIGLYAQWSMDASAPNQIYNLTNAQVMPKTAITPGGMTWIAWMDNTTGNYNTYLQKYDLMGYPCWTAPLLISDNTTMTWLTEWDIDCDTAGNAMLTFQDIRLGTNNVVVYKISPDAAFLWGEDGIMLSTDTSTSYSNMSPTLLCLDDGSTIVAWQKMNTTTVVKLQSISSAGTLEWGQNGVTLSSPSARYTWPQLLASDACCVLVKYYEDTGPVWASNRKLMVQKYSDSGQPLWTNPTTVQALGGISAWTQWLSIASDNLNGMIICWHDDRNMENIYYSYIQRILVNGTVTMPANGVLVSTEPGYHQFYPKLAYNPTEQMAYIFWNRVNSNQNNWGLQMQKMALNGERNWGASGLAFVNQNVYPTYPIKAFNMQDGVVFLYTVSPQANNDQLANIKGYCVSHEGLPIWNGGLGNIATTTTLKLHYDSDAFNNFWGVVVWEDGSGNPHIYAMRFNTDGSLGTPNPTPFNLTASILNENSVLLNWEFPEVFNPPVAFKVYKNGQFFHLVANDGNNFDLIPNLDTGEYSFYVTAFYQNDIESQPSNTVTVTITNSIDEYLSPMALTVYIAPNPFSNQLFVSIRGIKPSLQTSITVYNVKGQIVKRDLISGSKDAEWFWNGKDHQDRKVETGLYLIKVSDLRSSIIRKVLKY